jgi:hypothetical protein
VILSVWYLQNCTEAIITTYVQRTISFPTSAFKYTLWRIKQDESNLKFTENKFSSNYSSEFKFFSFIDQYISELFTLACANGGNIIRTKNIVYLFFLEMFNVFFLLKVLFFLSFYLLLIALIRLLLFRQMLKEGHAHLMFGFIRWNKWYINSSLHFQARNMWPFLFEVQKNCIG